MSTEEHKRTEGARTKTATAGTIVQSGNVGGVWKFHKKPSFLATRVAIWDEYMNVQKEKYLGMFFTNTSNVIYFLFYSFPKKPNQGYLTRRRSQGGNKF